MSNVNAFGIALSVIVVASGCRPAGSKSSDTKTLDQMASGSGMSLYSCAATPVANSYVSETAMQHVILPDGSSCGKNSDAKCAAVKDVLSIIAARNPMLVQNYFDTIKGNVKISEAAVEVACRKPFSDANSPQFVSEQDRKTIAGCWSIAQMPDGSSVTALVMSEDPAKIRQGGIRIMGMFYGQAVQQMSKNASGKFVYDPNYTPTDGVRKTLWDKKKELALLFLDDVRKAEVSSGGKYKLENIKSLDANAVAAVRNSPDTKSLNIDTIFPNAVKMQRFVDTVMGEAFDSGFCQAEQNIKANATSFAGTMGVFNSEILPDLSALASAMGTPASQAPVSASTAASSNQGFGLMGGGFFASLMGLFGQGAAGGVPNQQQGTPYYPQQGVNPANPTNNPQLPGYNPSLPANVAQQPGYINPSQQRFAQPGIDIAMLGQIFKGCSGGNCSCADGQCSNCTGGCAGGNCSCPGGNCNCQNIG